MGLSRPFADPFRLAFLALPFVLTVRRAEPPADSAQELALAGLTETPAVVARTV